MILSIVLIYLITGAYISMQMWKVIGQGVEAGVLPPAPPGFGLLLTSLHLFCWPFVMISGHIYMKNKKRQREEEKDEQ